MDCLCEKIQYLQGRLDVPFAIENITRVFPVPDDELAETEFIDEIQKRTGAGLLFDFNNIYTNGINFGMDPHAWLEEIAPERVDSIHLAGGYFD